MYNEIIVKLDLGQNEICIILFVSRVAVFSVLPD